MPCDATEYESRLRGQRVRRTVARLEVEGGTRETADCAWVREMGGDFGLIAGKCPGARVGGGIRP